MEIIEFDLKYTQEIYDFVMGIKAGEIGWKSEPTDLPDIPAYYLADNGNFWLVLDKGKIVGTIALKNMGNNQGYLKRMYVSKELRGKGTAQELLKILLGFATEKKMTEIYLATTTNPVTERAVAFYKKSGFVIVPKLPENFADDDDNVFMKLII